MTRVGGVEAGLGAGGTSTRRRPWSRMPWIAALALVIVQGATIVHSQTGRDEASGEEPFQTIVVTATRTETKLDETPASLTVVDEGEIQARHAETVGEALRTVPGVDVVQTGSRGTETDLFIRGADADQTLILVDGVEVNSVTLGAFDFANLTTDNVERIEILRGAGGTLYGSQAIGGVVNIITKEGSGAPRFTVSGEGGSAYTGRGTVSSSGQYGKLRYSIAGAYLHTDGFRVPNDDYRNGTASLRLDYDATENATARFFMRYTDATTGLFNSNNFLPVSDPNARISDELFLVKGEWEQTLIPDLELRLAGSYTRDDQRFRDPPDPVETSLTLSKIPSEIVTGEVQLNHYWRQIATTTAGIEIEERSANVRSDTIDPAFEFRNHFDDSQRNVAGYFQEQLRLLEGDLVAIGGVRVDGNEKFGTAVSPEGSASYRIPVVPGLRVKAGYAEGFKAPTFNELFFPSFGNPNLDAETSREYNVGIVETAWSERARLEVTYFDRKVQNLIQGAVQDDGLFLATNVGDVHVRGVEVAPSVLVWREPAVTLTASYARLDTVSGGPLTRRPKDRGALVVNVAGRDLGKPRTRYHVNLTVLTVGDRPDVDPDQGFAVRRNPAYARVDLAASYTFEQALAGRGDLTLFGKIENLTDERYEEALDFRSPRLNFLAGVRATF
jgi:vitamin B12 transporter